MTARAIIAGSLTKPPIRKMSSKGKAYVLATIREGSGDTARFWSAFVFSETVVADVERLQVGEPIAVAGELDAKVFVPQGGEARVSLSVKVDAVLTAKRPKRQRDAGHALASADRKGGADFDDSIPF